MECSLRAAEIITFAPRQWSSARAAYQKPKFRHSLPDLWSKFAECNYQPDSQPDFRSGLVNHPVHTQSPPLAARRKSRRSISLIRSLQQQHTNLSGRAPPSPLKRKSTLQITNLAESAAGLLNKPRNCQRNIALASCSSVNCEHREMHPLEFVASSAPLRKINSKLGQL